ncbi:unnamed protein product [Adineta ricciae]|uniref:Uncharacterized protein n=1 Tax=Adineta ricciae TaxID=249248 RepID=A0A815R025_ADIRI|nr:unnamed protein product [Adineta ricciae]
MLGAKRSKTVSRHMCYPEMRKPLLSIVPQFFLLRNDSIGAHLATLLQSSLMRQVQSFELDDNCLLSGPITGEQLRIPEAVQLTHIRCQLQSLTVTIAMSNENRETLNNVIQSISCPNLKHLTIKMYRNFKNFDVCLCLLERLSSVEQLTLILAIDETDTTPIHFVDQLFSEKNIYRCIPNLHQFHFHIRSIFKGASQTTVDQILQGFVKREHHQSFHCVIDHFNNSYGQCQIYSLPFIGTRLDFVSNRFPFFDNHSTFSSVTTMLLFDDVEPFENVFFERIAQVLPRLRTLEIINPLEQKKKSAVTKTSNARRGRLAIPSTEPLTENKIVLCAFYAKKDRTITFERVPRD